MNLKDEILAGESHSLEFKLVPNEDRITSLGGLPRGQTVERAIAGFSKIRNEVLAKALNYMRIIEEWGSGLRCVNGILRDYGTGTVELEDAGLAVRMNVLRNTVTSGETAKANTVTAKLGGVTVNDTVNVAVNDDRNRLLSLIKAHPGMRAEHYAQQLGKTRRTIMRYLSQMSAKVEFRGAPKTGGYYYK